MQPGRDGHGVAASATLGASTAAGVVVDTCATGAACAGVATAALSGHSGVSFRQHLPPLWAKVAAEMKMATKAIRMCFIVVVLWLDFFLRVTYASAFGGRHTGE